MSSPVTSTFHHQQQNENEEAEENVLKPKELFPVTTDPDLASSAVVLAANDREPLRGRTTGSFPHYASKATYTTATTTTTTISTKPTSQRHCEHAYNTPPRDKITKTMNEQQIAKKKSSPTSVVLTSTHEPGLWFEEEEAAAAGIEEEEEEASSSPSSLLEKNNSEHKEALPVEPPAPQEQQPQQQQQQQQQEKDFSTASLSAESDNSIPRVLVLQSLDQPQQQQQQQRQQQQQTKEKSFSHKSQQMRRLLEGEAGEEGTRHYQQQEQQQQQKQLVHRGGFGESTENRLVQFILSGQWNEAQLRLTKSTSLSSSSSSSSLSLGEQEASMPCGLPGGGQGLALHLACSVRPLPPASLVLQIIQTHPEAAAIPEQEWGQLPLHFASSLCPPTGHSLYNDNDTLPTTTDDDIEDNHNNDDIIIDHGSEQQQQKQQHDENQLEIIRHLLQSNPGAVRVREEFGGMLPIHIAATTSVSEDGTVCLASPRIIEALIMAWPGAVSELDHWGESPLDIFWRGQRWHCRECRREGLSMPRQYGSTNGGGSSKNNSGVVVVMDDPKSHLRCPHMDGLRLNKFMQTSSKLLLLAADDEEEDQQSFYSVPESSSDDDEEDEDEGSKMHTNQKEVVPTAHDLTLQSPIPDMAKNENEKLLQECVEDDNSSGKRDTILSATAIAASSASVVESTDSDLVPEASCLDNGINSKKVTNHNWNKRVESKTLVVEQDFVTEEKDATPSTDSNVPIKGNDNDTPSEAVVPDGANKTERNVDSDGKNPLSDDELEEDKAPALEECSVPSKKTDDTEIGKGGCPTQLDATAIEPKEYSPYGIEGSSLPNVAASAVSLDDASVNLAAAAAVKSEDRSSGAVVKADDSSSFSKVEFPNESIDAVPLENRFGRNLTEDEETAEGAPLSNVMQTRMLRPVVVPGDKINASNEPDGAARSQCDRTAKAQSDLQVDATDTPELDASVKFFSLFESNKFHLETEEELEVTHNGQIKLLECNPTAVDESTKSNNSQILGDNTSLDKHRRNGSAHSSDDLETVLASGSASASTLPNDVHKVDKDASIFRVRNETLDVSFLSDATDDDHQMNDESFVSVDDDDASTADCLGDFLMKDTQQSASDVLPGVDRRDSFETADSASCLGEGGYPSTTRRGKDTDMSLSDFLSEDGRGRSVRRADSFTTADSASYLGEKHIASKKESTKGAGLDALLREDAQQRELRPSLSRQDSLTTTDSASIYLGESQAIVTKSAQDSLNVSMAESHKSASESEPAASRTDLMHIKLALQARHIKFGRGRTGLVPKRPSPFYEISIQTGDKLNPWRCLFRSYPVRKNPHPIWDPCELHKIPPESVLKFTVYDCNRRGPPHRLVGSVDVPVADMHVPTVHSLRRRGKRRGRIKIEIKHSLINV